MPVFDRTLIAFAGLALLLAMTPGPDMATITRNGLAHGRRGVALTALGITTALIGWIGAASFGVAALLQTSAQLFTIVRLAGAAYLAYLGIRTLWGSFHEAPLDTRPKPPAPAGRLYRTGLFSAGLNPKLGAFFVTLFPQFIEPGQPALARSLVLGAIFSTIGVLWMISYGLFVTRVRDVIGSQRVKGWMERVTGTVLVGLAARLALER
jgi:threonine/homoserine/homoserine lactone efflux protein